MSQGKKLGIKPFIIMNAIAAALIALAAIVGSALAFTLWDVPLTNFIGSTEPGRNNASSRLDLEYYKSGLKYGDTLSDAERALSEEIAGEGIVLLENDNCLPLPAGSDICFFGTASASFPAGYDRADTLLAAFESEGYDVDGDVWNFYSRYGGSSRGINECPVSVLTSGVRVPSSGTAVYVMSRRAEPGRDMPRGMYDLAGGEDGLRHYLEPDSVELDVVSYLCDRFDSVIIVVDSPNAVEPGWISGYDNIDAVLYAPQPGICGASALAGIFSGRINPSGRLADTFAADAFSAPSSVNFGDFRFYSGGLPTDYYYVSQREGIYVGYRYYETRYEDYVLGRHNASSSEGAYASSGEWNYAEEVTYPFGYGLSYATFALSGFTLTPSDGGLTASVTVTNTSSVFSGRQAVQFYVSPPYSDFESSRGIERASVSLAAFAKTGTLAPGESETVTAEIDESALRAYSAESGGYVLCPGDYYVTAAYDAHEAINNVLASKYERGSASGVTVDPSKMTGYGRSSLTGIYNVPEADVTAAASRFSSAAPDGMLSRSDWSAYPEPDGELSSVRSSFDERVGENGIGYQYRKDISSSALLRLTGTASLAPSSGAGDYPTMGVNNGTELIDLRGVPSDDERWDGLLANLTSDSLEMLVARSGSQTATILDINKPRSREGGNAFGIGTYDGLPSPVLIACTFDASLARRAGDFVGEVGLAENINGWYAPTLTVHRSPFGGDNAQSWSEDPLLTGVMGAAAAGGAAEKGIYAFLRGFGLDTQETHRGDNGLAVYAGEQAIREIYLRPFEIAVKSGTRTVAYYEYDDEESFESYSRRETEMPVVTAVVSGRSRIGETWSGGNYELLTGVLRDEWGFEGFVLTDGDLAYMDTVQMLRAGGDAKMSETGTFTDVHYNAEYARLSVRAAGNILYCLVNSALMNGFVHGVAYVPGMPYYYIIVIAVDVIAAAAVVLLVVRMVRRLRRDGREKEKPA